MKMHFALSLLVCTSVLATSSASAQQIFAQTGFNDQSGINSNPTAGSPYFTTGSGSLDGVIVRAVPEPAAVSVVLATGALLLRRRRH